MISLEEAMELVRRNAWVGKNETVAIKDALGRRLAGPVVARHDSPPFDNSAVDGYAIGSPIGPWRVTQVIPAGQEGSALGEGEAARIFTGAPIPPGCFAVGMQEDALIMGNCIDQDSTTTWSRGLNFRRKGEIYSAGSNLLSDGAVVVPPVLASLAADGRGVVAVQTMPSILLIATGGEVVSSATDRTSAKIFESNTVPIRALLESFSCRVTTASAGDNLPELSAEIQNRDPYDLILTIGGVSVGDYDFIRPAMQALAYEELFAGVAMQPGKPVVFARHPDGGVWFGLPGNPMSALVTTLLFVLTFLRRELKFFPVPLIAGCAMNVVREKLIPAKLEFEPEIGLRLNPLLGSHSTNGLVGATGLARVPSGNHELSRHDPVSYATFPWVTV